MARSPSHEISKRNREIVETYSNDLSVDLPFLEASFGLSRPQIKRILVEAGVKVRTSPGGALPHVRPLSSGHQFLSHRLNVHLALHGIGVAELATRVRVSEKRLQKMLTGVYDPRLSEMQRIDQVVSVGLPKEFHQFDAMKESS